VKWWKQMPVPMWALHGGLRCAVAASLMEGSPRFYIAIAAAIVAVEAPTGAIATMAAVAVAAATTVAVIAAGQERSRGQGR
jgi:hypothetical protein